MIDFAKSAMENKPAKRRQYAGRFLKGLRAAHGLRQSELAQRLEISPPYLSQLESDSRPLTLQLTARLRDLFPVDWSDMSIAPLDSVIEALLTASRDPVLRGGIPEDQIRRVAEQYPAFAAQFAKLFHLYRTNAHRLEAIDEALGADILSGGRLPWEEVRDWFNGADNYVHLIDSHAEEIATSLAARGPSPQTDELMGWFARRGITVCMDATAVLRSYDEQKRELRLNASQPIETLRFQMAFQICAIALEQELRETVEASGLEMQTARRLLSVGLINYAAGALLMPYHPFRQAARASRHDIDQLRLAFSASFEQVCHRLSTLQRPHARGVPVFFCKIDMGGNITKRHAANGLQFARFSGSCPLWIAHEAVTVPERNHLQVADMPEGGRYVFLARGQIKPSDSFLQPARRHALVLGWEASLASEFVYADALNMKSEAAIARIGISCRICSRLDCQQRAYPPNEKQISVETSRRGAIPYEIS